MNTIQHKVNIMRPVTDIFRFVADFSNTPQWQPDTVDLRRAGQLKLGDMVVGTRRVMGRTMHVNADVIEYVPNQTIIYNGVMGGFFFRTTYKFTFAGSGTDVTEIMEIRIPWWNFFLRPFVTGALDSQIKTGLDNLKRVMEARNRA
ncbi:MAG: SRPBCC family protein [Aggregatilineales bacterium]